jgi:DDE domain
MKSDGQLWRRTRLRQCKYLNNIVEQDHRRIKRLVRPGLGFGSFLTARQTLAGFETMAMMRKGQVRKIDGHDIRGQAVPGLVGMLDFDCAGRGRFNRRDVRSLRIAACWKPTFSGHSGSRPRTAQLGG